MVDGILTYGLFAEFVSPETIYYLRAKLEPTLQLESHGSDRVVVEVGVNGRLTLIVEVFFDHVVHLFVVASRDTT